MKGSFARVAVPRPIHDTFHYKVPEELAAEIRAGSVVVVPLGKRTVNGVVISLTGSSPVRARNILALADCPPVSDRLLELALWVSAYYRTPPGLVLQMLLPPGSGTRGIKFRLSERGRQAADDGGERPILALLTRGPRTTRYLTEHIDPVQVEDALEEGLIEPVLPSPGRSAVQDPEGRYSRDEERITDLTPDQSRALSDLRLSLDRAGFGVFLIHGVTGSGKTEIYTRAAEAVIDQERQVLFLVPEISLTPLLTARLSRVAPGRIAVLHSGQTPGARRASWDALNSGAAAIGVGVRSGVFAPLPRLGLIVVDEEHDQSYRQEEMPGYHARDVAVKRAQIEEVPVILGSATPSVESYRNAEIGRYTLLTLPERVTAAAPTEVEVINMADPGEKRSTHPSLSQRLADAVADTLGRDEQSLLFLNRRGFAPFLLCPECQYTHSCPNCSVTLTYHRGKGMVCHYCGHRQEPPGLCPSCGGSRIAPVGTGTQRLEDALRETFPGASIERLDRDVVSKPGALEEIYGRMDRREIQILVGTQILAKGHDFPNITLVGVVHAEQSLEFPDFRSAERTFQLIAQVSGRTGRGDRRGRVIVQSFSPDHYAVKAALAGDYLSFYRAECAIRSPLGYPPFGRLGRVLVDGVSEEKVQKACTAIARRVSAARGTRVLGPSPAPLNRIQNRHRWHVMVLADSSSLMAAALKRAEKDPGPGIRVHVRVDPYSLL